MKLDFSGPILDASNTPQSVSLGSLLSGLLMQSAAKPPIDAKYFVWGLALASTGIIEADDADKGILLDFINGNDSLTVLGRNRLREVITGTVVPTILGAVPAPEPEAVIPTPVPAEVANPVDEASTAQSDPAS